ncbi:MAG: glycosyltransferase family 4 protein [Planctomycetota bacterium]
MQTSKPGKPWTNCEQEKPLDLSVVFMTHYIPLYQVRVLQTIAARVREFHVLLSTPIEPNRDFTPDWSGLNVTVQKNMTMRRPWKHEAGFTDDLYVHVPTDTQSQLSRIDPDVVMSLELGARSAGAARYCRRNPNTKLILCTYMSEFTENGRGWMRSLLRRRLTRQADAITYNGPSCARYLRDTLHVPGPKLFPLPYAADDRHREATLPHASPEPTRGKFLCVGQLSERKGVVPFARQVIDYCQNHPERELSLSFVGDGPMRGTLESIAPPANLTFKLLGNRPAAELSKLYHQHSAVIAPTLADEWLLVVNEAMHASTPVIGSRYAQAVSSLVRHGVNGWQYDPQDDDSLADVLDTYFATSNAELAAMRSKAQDTVANRTPEWAASGAIDALVALTSNPWREADPIRRADAVRQHADVQLASGLEA